MIKKEQHAQLHLLEDEIIQISGLIKALQLLLSDDSATTCTTNAISERLERLEKQFYKYRKTLAENKFIS
ncbi:MAG: hypothetical protein AAF600_17730 [Bacteroidota bacterium]